MMDEFRKEETDFLELITRMTEQGKVEWKCTSYNPLSFMDEDSVDDSSAYLCQMFTLCADIRGIECELEIAEYISVPEGKGNLAITLTKNSNEFPMKIDLELSLCTEIYDSCTPDKLAAAFANDPIIRICDAVVPKALETDAVQETFEWARFINTTGISDDLLNNPLIRLARKLFNQRRFLDYHRIVLDITYRNQLLTETSEL